MNGFLPFLDLGSVIQSSILFLIPFFIALLVTPCFRFIAHKTELLDVPNGNLKKHEQATAYLGGVAIYVSAMFAYFFLFRSICSSSFFTLFDSAYFIGITILLCVGLIDDIFTISPLKKLLGQSIACVFFLKAGLFFKKSFISLFLPTVFCIPEIIFF